MGCSLGGVRVVKIELLALGLLLASFMAAGAVLISQETTPTKAATANQPGFAVYFYQNLSEVERQDASKLEEKPAEPRTTRAGFVLWLMGFPLAALGGLAVGISLRGQQSPTAAQHRRPVQYVVINPPRLEEPAVLKELTPATQRDNSNFIPLLRANTPRPCPMRFRSAALSSRRENQPR